jgi:hypothetical protein
MRATNAPKVLWDHCIELQALIQSHTALDLPELNGDVPETVISGDTADISHLCKFAWFDWVWFIHPTSDDMENQCLGWYLGPSHDVGQAMCSKILTEKARIVSRTSIFPLSVEDKNSEPVKQMQ